MVGGPPNKSLQRTGGHRGRLALAVNCVLAGPDWASCSSAELHR